MEERSQKFMKWERLYFKIYLGIVGFGIVLLLVMFAFQDYIEALSQVIAEFVVVLLIAIVVYFFLSLIRILKYVISIRKSSDETTIWRSVTTFFTSPIATVLYYVIIFVMLLSTASCTIA